MRFPIELKKPNKKNGSGGGDCREIIKFAWLPRKMERHWVWLEKYISLQKYRLCKCNSLKYEFKMKWAETNRRLI
jgi:hypothetical protein